MENEGLLISSANLNVLEDNLGYLANNLQGVVGNISTVTGQVDAVDQKMNSMTTEVKTLTEELREFMAETRNTTVVSNAKQNILMLENELNKKYGHYDTVRRNMSGILQATDNEMIKKTTIENVAEELMLKTPNYWLTPAIIAISAWINNNRDLANKSLIEAMNRNDEKTSLLFSYVHRRANKNNSSLIWLNRYLDIQDPSKMENKFITVLDSITSGVFGVDIKPVVVQKVNNWINELNNRNIYFEKSKNRWKEFILSNIVEANESNYPYLVKISPTWETLKNILSFSNTHKKINDYFSIILNSNTNNTIGMNNQIDKIINSLTFDYENEELEIRKELAKNKYIIEESGNVTKAEEKLKSSSSNFEEFTDLYDILTNIVLDNEYAKALDSTRKFALAILKPVVLAAYNEIIEEKNYKLIPDISIKINDWEGITKDGSNELELRNQLNSNIDGVTYNDVYSDKFVNYKMIIALIIALVGGYFSWKIIYLSLALIVIALIYCAYEVSKVYNKRKIKLKRVNGIKQNFNGVLSSCMAEIVDYKKIVDNNMIIYQNNINLLNSLNIDNFIMSNSNTNVRVINVGEENGTK